MSDGSFQGCLCNTGIAFVLCFWFLLVSRFVDVTPTMSFNESGGKYPYKLVTVVIRCKTIPDFLLFSLSPGRVKGCELYLRTDFDLVSERP